MFKKSNGLRVEEKVQKINNTLTTPSPLSALSLQGGFTLIELIIVFSLMALLSVAGMASFASFNQRQTLSSTIADLRTMFTVARSNTVSQFNAYCTANQQFAGYVVVVCCRNAQPPVNQLPVTYCPTVGCSSNNDYELYESCKNGNGSITNNFIQGKVLPPNVMITSQTTARTFEFAPITGKVTYGGNAVSVGSVSMFLSSDHTITQSTSVSDVGTIQ